MVNYVRNILIGLFVTLVLFSESVNPLNLFNTAFALISKYALSIYSFIKVFVFP